MLICVIQDMQQTGKMCCNIRQDIDINGYWYIIVCYNVNLGKLNSGFTHTKFNKRLSIVGIGITDSKEEFINTIAHEAKHVQSHICQYYNVNENSEQAAYLMGYLIERMYNKFKYYI